MSEAQLVFIAGLHRSGTSLIHEILRGCPETTGFQDTTFPEDEGQFLQTVYPRGSVYGGPGSFAFDPRSWMDERHPLATPANAARLMSEWFPHWDPTRRMRLEKSPPNIVRTRFLQALFPDAKFVVILRHPLAVAHATAKWNPSSIDRLVEHALVCYERFLQDLPHLRRAVVFRYEDFVASPRGTLDALGSWLGLEDIPLTHAVRPDVNGKYFARQASEEARLVNRLNPLRRRLTRFEARANAVGYSLTEPERLREMLWLGVRG